MYVPSFNSVDDEVQIREMVAEIGSAQLISVDADGFPIATLLPILWEGDTVVAHMARANPHWHEMSRLNGSAPVLLICSGPEAYISPSWYAAKYEHGRVVPTWNYSAVHLSGTARITEDPGWLRDAVQRLTVAHEADKADPWCVEDAPESYINGQLRGIVGIEVSISKVEAKVKLSQNRSPADRHGVVDGLRVQPSRGSAAVADAMAADL